MRWEPEVSRGAWIAPRLDDGWGTMHLVVPRGFEAYARVFHPVSARRPVGVTWEDLRSGPLHDRDDGWEVTAPASWEERVVAWREAADEFGLTWHPLFQWHRIVDTDPRGGSWNGVPGPDGWRFDAPRQGWLEPSSLGALARVLARYTSTPDAGCAAVWDGWGGLFGHGVAYFGWVDGAAADADSFVPPPPPLDAAVEDGPRLSLPMREHVLFDAGIREFEASDWPSRAPWVGASPLGPGHPLGLVETPSLIWPEDRAWVLVSEVDYDSTVVGGSRALVDELLARSGADAGLEIAEIPEGADLSWDGDRLNA